MRTYSCPACGADVPFASSLSVSAVCPYCSTLLVRHDVDVEALGKVAALPPETSPLQVGMQAHDGKTAFTVLGRVRLAWGDGFWNEWFFAAEDGRRGWLAEAQGTFALSYEYTDPLHENTRRALTQLTQAKGSGGVGTALTFDGRRFVITDRKIAVCVGCEGELPIVSPTGRRTISFDFMGDPDEFVSVEAADNGLRVFIGRYVEWADLKASHTRPVEGWPQEAKA